jgi:hypothetical protein
MELRDAFYHVDGGAAVFFNPLEFDPQGAGRVSQAAFAHALQLRYQKLDRNGDGTVEANELKPLPRNLDYGDGGPKLEAPGGDVTAGPEQSAPGRGGY